MLLWALLLGPGAVGAQTKLKDNVDQAVTILEQFRDIPRESDSEAVMRDAKGLTILTVLKAGFVFSGQGGLGLVVARTKGSFVHIVYGRAAGWSGPSAIATGGAGFGFQVGAEVTE
jgi:lipid-binding SYLF domain-containing protein